MRKTDRDNGSGFAFACDEGKDREKPSDINGNIPSSFSLNFRIER